MSNKTMTLGQLKSRLAKIDDIVNDPEFESKPTCIRNDLLIRKVDIKHAIDIHMAKMNFKKAKR